MQLYIQEEIKLYARLERRRQAGLDTPWFSSFSLSLLPHTLVCILPLRQLLSVAPGCLCFPPSLAPGCLCLNPSQSLSPQSQCPPSLLLPIVAYCSSVPVPLTPPIPPTPLVSPLLFLFDGLLFHPEHAFHPSPPPLILPPPPLPLPRPAHLPPPSPSPPPAASADPHAAGTASPIGAHANDETSSTSASPPGSADGFLQSMTSRCVATQELEAQCSSRQELEAQCSSR